MVNAIGTISTVVATALAFATGMLRWYSVPGLMANLITVQVDKTGRCLPFDLVVRVEGCGKGSADHQRLAIHSVMT